MLTDPLSVAAAVVGGLLGLAVMHRLGGRKTDADAPKTSFPIDRRSTGYASRNPPSAGPVLMAVGLAAVGVVLAVGGPLASIGVVLAVASGLVLAVVRALVRARRGQP